MGDTVPPKKSNWPDHVKTWGEAASAAFKAALHFVFLCLVLGAATMLLWREATTHALHVSVGKEVQSALTLHGGDIDLGLALQDALNDRLQAVHQIIDVGGMTIVGTEDEAPSVSFKPFGVDVTTDEVTRLTDLILNRPKPPTVRLELLCEGGPCSEATSHPASLMMSFLGTSGQRRAAYPLAHGTAALRRTIREAIQNTADVVLEQSEPGIASIWYLNRASLIAVSSDQYADDLSRAVGAAIMARPNERPSDCVSDLVIGVSLLKRNALSQGVAVEQRASSRSGRICQIHLLTNIVFNLLYPAYCDFNTDVRETALHHIAEAHARLQALQGSIGPDIVMLRVPTITAYVRLLDVMKAAGGEVLPNWCNGTPASAQGPPNALAAQISQVMAETRRAFPAHPTGDPMHGAVNAFWFAMRAAIHPNDLDGRVALDLQLVDMTRAYEAADPWPRPLYMLEGQIEMDIGNALIAAFPLGASKYVRLAHLFGGGPGDTEDKRREMLGEAVDESRNDALVAFENAQATHPVPFLDPPDIEVLGLLADAELVANGATAAQVYYGKAVDAFADANEPVEQLPALADILARWASSRIITGSCEQGAPADPVWQAAWTRLGFAAPDICTAQHAASPDAHIGTTTASLPSIVALVQGEMTRCPGPAGPSALGDLPVFESAEKKIQFVACHDGPQARMRFERVSHSTRSLDAELTKALVGSQ